MCSIIVDVVDMDGAIVTIYLYSCDVWRVNWELSPLAGGSQAPTNKKEGACCLGVVAVFGWVYSVPVRSGPGVA